MKTILAVIIGALLVVTAVAQQNGAANGSKSYMYADGVCYCLENGKDNLPAYLEGYWGYVNGRFDSGSIIFKLNGIDRELLMAKTTPDKQPRQCILLKRVNGILKAVPLAKATEEQLNKAKAEKKLFCYGKGKDVQDGLITCDKCQGKGKVDTNGGSAIKNFEKCPTCGGSGTKPNMVSLPEIKAGI